MGTSLPEALGARFDGVEPVAATPFERTFRAHDRVLHRDVLLKLPAREAAAGWSAPVADRMLREARALARIRHANVTPILWVEPTPEGPLLVLEPPDGETLAERLQRGPLDVDETIALGMQLGSALAAVHLGGVVHRAVGPTTVRLLANGRAQLGSFTFAKDHHCHGLGTSIVHARDGATPQPALPDYSAPEQIAGQAADPRADVYALGCTLFRCLAGEDPFPTGAPHGAPPDLRRRRPDAPRRLAEVVRRCMQSARTARYATAQEVVDALQAVRTVAPAPRPLRRTALAAAAAAGIGLIAWVANLGRDDDGAPLARGDEHAVEDRRYLDDFGPEYRRVHGLFVAIGPGYAGTRLPPLQNPGREVEQVIAQLRTNDPMWAEPGAIRVLADREATATAILGELQRLQQEARREDAVLLYFAGHGERRGLTFGFAAADAAGTVDNGPGYVRREVIHTFLRECHAKHVLVVLDCCHSGAVLDAGLFAPRRGRSPDDRDALAGARHRQRFSREVLCSARAHQTASDGTDLSPFCRHLLDQLRQPASAARPFVAARFLSSRIEEAMDQGLVLQEPTFRQVAEQEGSFVFRLAPPGERPGRSGN